MPAYNAWALAGFDAVWQACSDTVSFSVRLSLFFTPAHHTGVLAA